MSGKSILFVSHDSSRTGSPMVLLHFLKWLKNNTEVSFVILLKKDGELRSEFEKLAPTFLFSFNYPPYIGIKGKFKANWNTYFGIPSHYKNIKANLIKHNIGLIFVNSLGSGHILHFLNFLNCKVLTHIHEMEYGFHFNDKENTAQVLHYTNRYIAASNSVKANLIDNHGICADKIDVVYEFVEIRKNMLSYSESQSIKRDLLVPDNAFIVGAAGTMDLRKGFDLFISLVKEVYKINKDQEIYFVWIGGEQTSDFHFIFSRDAKKMNLEKFVRIPGSQTNPIPYFSCFDAFVMLSREDPFPLVCLEVATLAKPIICFDQSGGMPDFVEDDCGFVVPYLDIDAMANKVILLKDNPTLKIQMGANARQKVAARHDVSVSAPALLQSIKSFM